MAMPFNDGMLQTRELFPGLLGWRRAFPF